MEGHVLTAGLVREYRQWLYQNEKSGGTIQKYCYYLEQFQEFLEETKTEQVDKECVLRWKEQLKGRLAPSTVNGALAAVNGLFRYAGWEGCVVRLIRIRRQMFCSEKGELSRAEYERLVDAARKEKNERMEMLLQTVCSTGIRISELSYITAESLRLRYTQVDCKGKIRKIFLTEGLCRRLRTYCEKTGIKSGPIFITRTGRPMDRSNIWREMKKLAETAGVETEKVFPHNLRHLFARVYYNTEKDLLRLSDILGHSSINTTRIYTMESGETHIRQLEALNLLAEDYNRISLSLYQNWNS
ncbi:MAG: tyrosine-type recombinase/integrase [Eubacteriales bacterium]|nr:tyrosine-type recombinase/integrase [Eubacteriales bacterium]